MLISNTTIKELNKIQNSVSRFILQLPASSAKLIGFIDAGLQPMEYRIQLRSARYLFDLFYKKKDAMLKEVFTAVMMDQANPWTVQAKQILSNFLLFNIGKTKIIKQLSTLLISRLRAEVSDMVSLSWLPLPTNWFVLQPPVNDSRECKTLNSCRGENAGLGNRQSNRLGQSYKFSVLGALQ